MADGIGSMSKSMLGITDCSQLKWKTITKGKRSRKAVGRSKLAGETPQRVGEYSGSDSDKQFDEPSLADGLGCVPIKKRRHLLHSPSRNNAQSPPEQESPSLHSEKFEQLSDNKNLSCNQSLDLHSDIQRLAVVLENNSDDIVNLSGIALLATAACFDSVDDPDTVKQDVDVMEESPTLRKCNDTFTVTIPVAEPIQVQGRSESEQEKCLPVADPDNVTEESLTLRKCNDTFTVTVLVAEPIQVPGGSDPRQENCTSFADDSSGHILAESTQGTESISVSPKIDRCFWDLNKAVEEWEVPQDDLVVRNDSVIEGSIEEKCLAQLDSTNNENGVNHVSLAPVDVATASFESKVGGYTHEVAIGQVDDIEHVGPKLLKNYDQQMNLPEVSQMKNAEEDSQKTSELSEDRTVLVEDSVRKTCETMDVGMLHKCNDMSTSEISNADQLAVCGGGDGMGQEEKAIVNDAMDTNDASDHQDHVVSKGETVKTSISLDSVKTLVDDDHGLSDATQNISELQVDYDSPYEDGELRLPALYSCDRNEIVYDEEETECVDYESDGIVGDESDPGDHPGSEVVEAGSEGSQAPEKKYSVPAQKISETVTSNSSLNFKEENNVVKLPKPEAKRHSNQGSGTTDEFHVMPLVQDNNDGMMRRERNFDHADRFNSRGGSYHGLTREKSQPYNVSNMSSKFGGDSFSRSERGRGGADRSVARRGSSFGGHRQTGGYNNWNYKDSANRYQYRGSEDNWQQTKTRNAAAADSIDKFDDVSSYEHDHQPLKISSKGIQRPFFRRRSPVDRDDYYGDHGGFTLASSGYNNNNNNKRGSFGKFSGRGFGRGRREEEYVEPAVDDAVSSGRFSGGYSSRGEQQRSFSPSNSRAPHVSVPSWKSRSRSRTRSPHGGWQSQRERNLNTRRRNSRSRSPEFRPESSIERTRGPVPYQKRSFNADYTERFISPPKARFSPTRNNRWVNNDNRNFANPPFRGGHRRSPPVAAAAGAFRQQQSQRFGGQPGRFGSVGDNNNKSEENCGDRKHDQRFGLVDHNVRHSGTSNILRRPRHHDDDTNVNCEDDDNSNNNNNEGGGGRRDMSSFGGADYEERFSSPQHNNNRWSDERDLDNNNNNDSPSSRHGNSPSGMVRRVQRPKQDDYFRPSVTRPGRFTTSNGGGGGDWGNNGRRRNLE